MEEIKEKKAQAVRRLKDELAQARESILGLEPEEILKKGYRYRIMEQACGRLSTLLEDTDTYDAYIEVFLSSDRILEQLCDQIISDYEDEATYRMFKSMSEWITLQDKLSKRKVLRREEAYCPGCRIRHTLEVIELEEKHKGASYCSTMYYCPESGNLSMAGWMLDATNESLMAAKAHVRDDDEE